MNQGPADTPPSYSYVGCCYPLLTIGALISLLALLSTILEADTPQLPLQKFTPLADYPDALNLREAVLIANTGLTWLMLVYVYWFIALTTCAVAILQLQKAIACCAQARRRTVNSLLAAVIAGTVAALFYVTVIRDTPLMSFEYLLRNLQLVSQGLVDLYTYTTALAYVVLVTIVVTVSLLLMPDAHNADSMRQFRGITLIMYCAAAFLLAWIVQATEMYRLAATLLVENERVEVLKLAPTISLVVGVFASLLLGCTYLAAYFWLQSGYRDSLSTAGSSSESITGQSPRRFLLNHWPQITAVLMPAFPGVISTFISMVTQTV